MVNPDGRASERSDVLTLFADGTNLLGRTPVSAGGVSGGCPGRGAADFDGDGLVDAGPGLLGGCTPVVRAGLFYRIAGAGWAAGAPNLVEIADVTGDGKLDVVSSTLFRQRALVFSEPRRWHLWGLPVPRR